MYVAVIVVVAVMLVVSYRALAGGEVLAEEDYRTALRSLTAFTQARAREFGDAVNALAPAAPPDEDALTAAAVSIRKKLSGYQQQLSRFEAGIGDDLDAARVLLSAAIEDLGWACRMIEPGTYGVNPGIRAAVAILADHGRECISAAALKIDGAAISSAG